VRRGCGRSLRCQPEQLVDDAVLGEDILFGYPLQLAFAEPVHGFIALDGPLCRVEASKRQAKVHLAFHKPMILFHDIVQIFAWSQLTARWKCAVVLKGVEG
jgi:hypothetical protein